MRAVRLGIVALLALSGWAVGASAVAGHASAAPCGNGATCAPDTFVVSPSATLLASTSGTLTAGGSFTASYTEYVYRDPSNEYCATCLDFVIQVTNSANSTDPLARVTNASFTGYSVDAGYTTTKPPGAATPGTAVPAQVGRSNSGSVVSWYFNTPATEIQPGQGTITLVAETNAPQFVPGIISAEDGGAAQNNAFQPSGTPAGPPPNVPEAPFVPALGLLGGAFGGWAALRRWGRSPAV